MTNSSAASACDLSIKRFAISEERWIPPKNANLQALEVFVRIDTEIGDEEPTKIFIGRKRFDLSTAAVERDHLMRAQSLSPRVCIDPRVDIRKQLEMTTATQIRGIARLDQSDLQLTQATGGSLVEREAHHVGEGLSRPAFERGVELQRRPPRVGDVERSPRLDRV